jgi:hypothetical protein
MSLRMNDPSGFSALCIAERISEASNRRENAKGVGEGDSGGDGWDCKMVKVR